MSSSNLETALQAKPAPVLCPKRPRLLLLLLPNPTIPAINDYGVSTLIEWATLLSGFAAACSAAFAARQMAHARRTAELQAIQEFLKVTTERESALAQWHHQCRKS
jgi:hypothetical protein